ncbi:MAG: enoyl-CoA hydratase-related protein [Candidatus Velthaea sp.]
MSAPVDHRVEIVDAVATIIFERPAAYNAVTGAMLLSLQDTMKQLARDPAVRALVITGAGKGFCAGQALDDPSALDETTGRFDLLRAVTERFNPFVIAVATIEKPVVAAVNGVAAGAGMGIALAADFRFVASSASFTTAFAKIGLVPDSGVSYFLPRMVGYGRALELTLLSEKIDALRAHALGLVTKLCDDTVLEQAQAFAATLARGPRSLGLIKRELVRNGLGDLQAALTYEAQLQAVAGESGDFLEGVAAFLEKRQPVFRGV